ncbi:MAG: dihydrofolate reductase [Rikenellaceae bacterium]
MISIIVAVAQNGVIGSDNQMPWHISEDLKYFKRTTLGCSIIMGRKTFESFPKALPGRRNIVISRNSSYLAEGAEVAHSLESALEMVGGEAHSFIIGGGEIYRQAMPLVDRLYITEVGLEVEGDTCFPEVSLLDWAEVSREAHDGFSFVVYKRRG